jgi:KipI family sensor histidine kinase inhibitor
VIYPEPKFLPCGDSALSVELGDEISDEANSRVRALDQLIKETEIPGITETVPTFRSLLVLYDPLAIGWEPLVEALRELIPRAASFRSLPGRVVEIPCRYGGEMGPELPQVAGLLGLTEDEVARLHSGTEFLVSFIGFTPGLPFLTGLHQRLTIPRRDTPRTTTPAGSVGIGGIQCSIYSVESPGGHRVIGRTPLRLYDPSSADPILLRPGDRVRFRPIDDAEFASIASAVENGSFAVKIEEASG